MHVSSFLISGETRETRWLTCLLAIQPLTQTRRFLLLMRAFSSPLRASTQELLKLFFAKRRHFGLPDVNIIA